MNALTGALAPLLVFAWGNRSRGDDALGPLLLDRLRASLPVDSAVDCLEDYQLQIEHALDLLGRARVLFVDASLTCRAPFEVISLAPARDLSLGTHSLSAQALLQVFCDLHGHAPPASTLLAIRGEAFELGAPLSPAAQANLERALVWCRHWLSPMALERPQPIEG
ncbi:MAG: hydrogenase maturation protease [Comamonadaceae bacterium]|nr:MAG: hydrogenase maturation protease [Comamonadaceae bacterium]